MGRPRCRPARMISGRSARPCSGRVSTGEPQSRISSVPASRSVSAWPAASSSGTAPVRSEPDVTVRVDQPGHEEAAVDQRVRPGPGVDEHAVVDVELDLVGASTGPSSVPRSRCTLLLRELQLRRVEAGRQLVHPTQARRKLAEARRQLGQVGHPRRQPARGPSAGGRPASLGALLALAALAPALGGAAAAGSPNRPAICFIILRASKNRLTRSFTSLTATPGAVGDAQPAGAVDDLRVGPLRRASCRG